MAIASIESLRNGIDLKTGVSRNDLAVGDLVTVRSLNVGTSYQWSIAFKPEAMDGLPSNAVFSTTTSEQAVDKDPGTFEVDLDGPYLLRLVYTTPQITLNYVLAAGVFFNVNGIKLIATAGARVSGSNDFSVASGTIAGITAEMVAALNDAGNSFVGADLEGTDASPHVIINPTVETVPTGETVTITYSGTASDVTISDFVSEQFVRLRALTAFGALKLVAAGERYDTLKVPTDATFDGWVDEQNFNLKALLGFAKTSAASGRVIYVDPETGDFTTIQAAIDHAVAQVPPPSSSQPWVVLVRPGVYQEDVAFAPYVHVFGWPGGTRTDIVIVQCASVAGHTANLPGAGEYTCVADLELKQPPVTTPVLTQSGSGSLTLYRCTTTGQISITGSGSLEVGECLINGNGAGPLDYGVQVGSGCNLKAERCVFTGQSVILAADLSQVTLDDCEVQASGTYAINTLAESTLVLFTSVTSGLIGVNEGGVGVGGNLSFQAHFSYLRDVSIDDDNVGGVASFQLGATAHGTITEHNTAVMAAGVPADTIFYDNAMAGHPVPLVASDVQEALDEIYTYAAAVRTLDDAYRSTGTARTIVADIGAVQIVDAVAPSDPIPPDNTNGNLNVVGAVKLGAISKPEINLDPNPFDNGPVIRLGHEIWANDAPYGGNAWVMGNATGPAMDHNYNLILGTMPAEEGTNTGRVLLMGGNALSAVDAGSIYIQGGTGQDVVKGLAGDIYLVPGESAAGAAGQVFLVDQSTGTGATLAGSVNFTNPMVAGDVTFGTNSGPLVVSFAGGEDLAGAHAILAATGVVTTNGPAGDPIVLTTVAKGPTAEIYFLAESGAGVDATLGGFNGQVMAPGTWPSTTPLTGAFGWPTSTGADMFGLDYEMAELTPANAYVVIQPGAAGAIQTSVNDGTPAGGMNRGSYATDWQRFRTAATAVASGQYATISGGRQNQASGQDSAVSGGQANRAASDHCAVSGGFENFADDDANAIAGGYQNQTFQPYSAVVGGRENRAKGEGAVAMGIRSNTILSGQVVHASGSFTGTGDGSAQHGRMVLRTTTNNGAVEMDSNAGFVALSANDYLTLGNNTGHTFTLHVIARSTAVGETAWWSMEGCVIRDANAATTLLVGGPPPAGPTGSSGGSAAAFAVNVTADTVNGRLKIEGDSTGYVGDVRWVATLQTTQVAI